MIHFIYIYIIINTFFTGLGADDFKREYKTFYFILIMILGLFFALPFIICYFLFHFINTAFQATWLANYIFVKKVTKGKKPISRRNVEILNEIKIKKLKKEKLTVNDRVYIWGVDKITEYYNLNKK